MTNLEEVNKAFSSQAARFDSDDASHAVLQKWRQQVYAHVMTYLHPGSSMLELNAGTGIDAMYFVQQGAFVLATDMSDGMVAQLHIKAQAHAGQPLRVQQCDFTSLDEVKENNFDYIFSNFGGLNCIPDLTQMTRHLPAVLKKGGIVTLVIMPPFSLWELGWVFKGQFKKAFRRAGKNGTTAHLEGQYFQTYYHSLRTIQKAMGQSFTLLSAEGIGAVSPPASSTEFYRKFPNLCRWLGSIDHVVRKFFPFNRWADHIIVTFQLH